MPFAYNVARLGHRTNTIVDDRHDSLPVAPTVVLTTAALHNAVTHQIIQHEAKRLQHGMTTPLWMTSDLQSPQPNGATRAQAKLSHTYFTRVEPCSEGGCMTVLIPSSRRHVFPYTKSNGRDHQIFAMGWMLACTPSHAEIPQPPCYCARNDFNNSEKLRARMLLLSALALLSYLHRTYRHQEDAMESATSMLMLTTDHREITTLPSHCHDYEYASKPMLTCVEPSELIQSMLYTYQLRIQ